MPSIHALPAPCLLAITGSVLAKPIVSRQTPQTGLQVLSNLQGLSLVYQDLTFATNSLSSPTTRSDPAAIVAQYVNITSSETGDEVRPQPPFPVDDFDQYGILSAQLNLVISDRAFLHALTVNKEFFNATLRATLRNVISTQLNVTGTVDSDVGSFAPDVLAAADANSAFLDASLQAALNAIS